MDGVNEKTEKSILRKRAWSFGFTGILAYTTGYVVRNLLGVATPEMTVGEGATFTTEFVGLLSLLLLISYATGQLFSGFLGDTIRAKYMVLISLLVVGTVNIVFSFTTIAWLQILCFVLMGLSLSMLRGPITKMISESLDKDRAQFICTLIFVFSHLGPFLASALAIIFRWQQMFLYAGIFTLCVGAFAFVSISIFEKKGWIVFRASERTGFAAYKGLFRIDGVLFFMIIGGVTEIANTAITFWLPTYFADALKLSDSTAQLLNMVAAILNTVAPFITLMIYRLIKKRDVLLLRCAFPVAIVCFIAMIFIPDLLPNILLFMVGKTALSIAEAVLWSIFIPSMGKTGKVSSISGVIDCAGYIAAAAASFAFGQFAGANWTVILSIWAGIAVVGLVASCIRKQNKNA
ncbi:MAG: MFS transporter [Clostridia bacterium]|nr:MFS transporter [Clostridia bacterium]